MMRIPVDISRIGVEIYPGGFIVRKKTEKINRKNLLGDTVICPDLEYIPFPVDDSVEFFISGYAVIVIQDELQGKKMSLRKFAEYVAKGLITRVRQK